MMDCHLFSMFALVSMIAETSASDAGLPSDAALPSSAALPTDAALRWVPVFAPTALAAIAVVLALVVVLAALSMRRPLHRSRWGMIGLRIAALAMTTLIVLCPMHVRLKPSPPDRKPMVILIDGSRSMTFTEDGGDRWTTAITTVRQAFQQAGEAASDLHAYQFGRRLESFDELTNVTSTDDAAKIPPCPKSSETRLSEALRRVIKRYGVDQQATTENNSAPISGILVVSDGRVSRLDQCESAAEQLAVAGVPIHVLSVGRPGSGGDVAIASASVPSLARKFSKVPIELFLRSFGMSETPAKVSVWDTTLDPHSLLLETSITLTGGPQAISMQVPIAEKSLPITITVSPDKGRGEPEQGRGEREQDRGMLGQELSLANNSIETEIEIDRSKVRVLYVEGEPVGQSAIGSFFSFGSASAGVTNWLSEAIGSDVDIECSAFAPTGTRGTFRSIDADNVDSRNGFPNDRPGMYAYDLMVLSNVSLDQFTGQQAAWMADAINDRGGGLWLCGKNTIEASKWNGSPLEELLPYKTSTPGSQVLDGSLQAAAASHPIWKFSNLPKTDATMRGSLPDLRLSLRPLSPTGLAETLATLSGDDESDAAASAVMLAADRGRGRVLASSLSLGGRSGQLFTDAWKLNDPVAATKFIRNIVYWTTERSFVGRRRVVAQSDKRFYRGGETIGLQVVTFDETSRPATENRVWCSLMPTSLDDTTLYSPVRWPDGMTRTSGETNPAIAWGEEFELVYDPKLVAHVIRLDLSDSISGDGQFIIEATGYQGDAPETQYSHGTQVDSTSIDIRVMNDPFELRNPLPNHELLARLAKIANGKVVNDPAMITSLIRNRSTTAVPPTAELSTAWDRWWWYGSIVGLLGIEWIWRRRAGMA